MVVFLIGTLGYLIGGVKIRGIELGTAGVLLAALVFGHFGFVIDAFVRNLGLVCFVTSVGFIAGPKFFRNFKQNAKSYVLLGLLIILSGALCCAAIVKLSAYRRRWASAS
jgi:putative transport protein